MEILGKYGKEEVAILYIARYDGKIIEFVESVQPPVTREQKWVLILSTLYGVSFTAEAISIIVLYDA